MVQLPWETVWRLLKKLERHVQKNQKQSPKHVCTPLFQQRYSLQQKAEAAARIPEGRWVGLRSISQWHTARPEKAARPDTRHDMDEPQRRYAEGTKPVPKR